ncbi:MAG: cbb3-type cytochrome oxidase assembly protein CcoS [Bacteroidales bacterium]|nr:cbb3-type cytochrome oxidase assembly protein CcoS [Bacteroidales bacterium]
MSVIVLLVIIGILVAAGFLIAFIWAVRSGQYDDSYSPSVRILFDDLKESKEPSSEEELPNKPK